MEISNGDFLLLRDYVNQRTGLFFEDKKKYLFDMRVDKRVKEVSCDTASEYYRILKFGLRVGELDNLVNLLTTNETYFFRNLPQLQTFSDEVLPELIRHKNDTHKEFNIWSAGCSTGEEPYTLAMLVRDKLKDLQNWNIQILATDIDREALEECRKGIYGSRSIKDVPPQYLMTHFTYSNGFFMVKPEVRRMVNFGYLNLIDKIKMTTFRDMDIIFCRNVLIYFDLDSARQVVNGFYDSLKPGGYIFLGHSESMSRLSAAFKLVRLKNGTVYVKE